MLITTNLNMSGTLMDLMKAFLGRLVSMFKMQIS